MRVCECVCVCVCAVCCGWQCVWCQCVHGQRHQHCVCHGRQGPGWRGEGVHSAPARSLHGPNAGPGLLDTAFALSTVRRLMLRLQPRHPHGQQCRVQHALHARTRATTLTRAKAGLAASSAGRLTPAAAACCARVFLAAWHLTAPVVVVVRSGAAKQQRRRRRLVRTGGARPPSPAHEDAAVLASGGYVARDRPVMGFSCTRLHDQRHHGLVAAHP
jgi:hypothetical protein